MENEAAAAAAARSLVELSSSDRYTDEIARDFEMKTLTVSPPPPPPNTPEMQHVTPPNDDDDSSILTPSQMPPTDDSSVVEELDVVDQHESMDTNAGESLEIAENILDEEMDTTVTFTQENRLPEANTTTTPVTTGHDVTGFREQHFMNRRNRVGLYSREEDLRQIKLWNNHPLSYHQAVNQLRLHNYQVGPYKK